jgi:hypothetical protein
MMHCETSLSLSAPFMYWVHVYLQFHTHPHRGKRSTLCRCELIRLRGCAGVSDSFSVFGLPYRMSLATFLVLLSGRLRLHDSTLFFDVCVALCNTPLQ